jgi:hypothetical protein
VTVTAVPAAADPEIAAVVFADHVARVGGSSQARAGPGTFCGVFQFGSLGYEDIAESLRLFAGKVLASLRGLP